MPYLKSRGGQFRPLNPAMMARACRQLAADLRNEAELGWDDVPTIYGRVSRKVAAEQMDRQAARWEAEAVTGVRNEYDRRLTGQ